MLTSLDGLQHCVQLRFLDVSHNHLESMHASVFGELTKLKELDVSHNSIREIRGLHKCTALEELVLDHNMIASAEPRTMRSLATRLDALSLRGNLIGPTLDDVFCAGAKMALTEVSLADNAITSVTGIVMSIAPGLEILHIDGNRIPSLDATIEELSHAAESLCELSIAGNAFSQAQSVYTSHVLEALPNLVQLDEVDRAHIGQGVREAPAALDDASLEEFRGSVERYAEDFSRVMGNIRERVAGAQTYADARKKVNDETRAGADAGLLLTARMPELPTLALGGRSGAADVKSAGSIKSVSKTSANDATSRTRSICDAAAGPSTSSAAPPPEAEGLTLAKEDDAAENGPTQSQSSHANDAKPSSSEPDAHAWAREAREAVERSRRLLAHADALGVT